MTNQVRNTAEADPMQKLVETMGDGGIERQEARGQSELVNSEVLPTHCSDEARATLEARGVVFGDEVEGDPIFTSVTLPDGWKKVATDHSMWSELQDETGKVVANIFYKAAFYDRSTHLNLARGGA